MNLDLTDKYAIVCGSTQGLGFASAVELALLGANVTLVARNEEKLKDALTHLDSSLQQKHNYVVADFCIWMNGCKRRDHSFSLGFFTI